MYVTFPGLGDWGRLGNQLFQIAGVLGVAKDRGGIPRIGPWRYRDLFCLPEGFCDPLPTDEKILPCYGYMQRLSIFEPVADQVLAYFQPTDQAREKIEKLFGQYGDVSDCVAIHVRRGDYAYLQHQFYYLRARYYERALSYLRTVYPVTRILLFSDEPELAASELSGLNVEVVRPSQPDELEDAIALLFMARCRAYVIANSTYSWWPAWLSRSEFVCYPSRWGVGNFEFQTRVKTIIPSGWSQIDAS